MEPIRKALKIANMVSSQGRTLPVVLYPLGNAGRWQAVVHLNAKRRTPLAEGDDWASCYANAMFQGRDMANRLRWDLYPIAMPTLEGAL